MAQIENIEEDCAEANVSMILRCIVVALWKGSEEGLEDAERTNRKL